MAISNEQLFAAFDQLQNRFQLIEAKNAELEASLKQLEQAPPKESTNGSN